MLWLKVILTLVSVPGIFAYAEFELFEDADFECCSWGCGTCQKFHVDDNTCMNFNFYDDKVSSIDTQGTCIKIYEHRNCQGAHRILEPDDYYCNHADLSNCGWDDRMSSISDCKYGEIRSTTTTTTPKPLPISSEYVQCPNGTWVSEIRVKPGYTYGLELDCYAPGADTSSKTILAAKGVTMGRNLLSHCDNQAMRGIYVSINEAQGYCQYEEYTRFPYGTLCGSPKQAVCGISLKKQGNSITAGGPLCCTVPNPAKSCRPTDRYQLIKECDNTRGKTPMDCSYQKTVGVSVSRSSSASNSRQANFYSSFYSGFSKSSGTHSSDTNTNDWNLGLSLGIPKTPIGINGGVGGSRSQTTGISSDLSETFNNEYGKSSTTGYDWSDTESSSWNEETVSQVSFTVESGMRTRLEQVVGECGFMQVRTNYIRKRDFDPSGNPFTSGLSFTSTTQSPQEDEDTIENEVSDEEISVNKELFRQFQLWLKTFKDSKSKS